MTRVSGRAVAVFLAVLGMVSLSVLGIRALESARPAAPQPVRTTGVALQSPRLGTDIVAVEVSVVRGNLGAPVQRTLTGAAAAALATLVNRLDVDRAGLHPCPMPPFTRSDSLLFRGVSGQLIWAVQVRGCGRVFLEIGTPGTPAVAGQVVLTGAGELDHAVLEELDLPTKYGI